MMKRCMCMLRYVMFIGLLGFRLSASPVISGNPEHHRQQAHEYTPQLSDLTRRMFGQGETAVSMFPTAVWCMY